MPDRRGIKPEPRADGGSKQLRTLPSLLSSWLVAGAAGMSSGQLPRQKCAPAFLLHLYQAAAASRWDFLIYGSHYARK